MGRLLIVSVVCLGVMGGTVLSGTDNTAEMMMETLDLFNLYSNCFSERALISHLQMMKKACYECGLHGHAADNQQPAVAASIAAPVVARQIYGQAQQPLAFYRPMYVPYGRKKREAEAHHGGVASDLHYGGAAARFSTNEVAEFLGKVADFKEMNQDKWEGLNCVLQKMGMVDAYGGIKLSAFTEDFWTHAAGAGAAVDPEFRTKLNNGFTDCYDVSNSWPATMLNRHEWTRQHGRFYIFFQCAKKMKQKACYQYRCKQVSDAVHGSVDGVDHAQYGFPSDKYDAAEMAMRINFETMTPAQKFIHEFSFSKAKFL